MERLKRTIRNERPHRQHDSPLGVIVAGAAVLACAAVTGYAYFNGSSDEEDSIAPNSATALIESLDTTTTTISTQQIDGPTVDSIDRGSPAGSSPDSVTQSVADNVALTTQNTARKKAVDATGSTSVDDAPSPSSASPAKQGRKEKEDSTPDAMPSTTATTRALEEKALPVPAETIVSKESCRVVARASGVEITATVVERTPGLVGEEMIWDVWTGSGPRWDTDEGVAGTVYSGWDGSHLASQDPVDVSFTAGFDTDSDGVIDTECKPGIVRGFTGKL